MYSPVATLRQIPFYLPAKLFFFPPFCSFGQEFEIIMVKQQGSLGFTLRKEDESVLGHYVRALVRPPATDGIIKPGDKIVAVSLSGCEQAAGDIIIKFSERSLGSLYRIITSHVFVPFSLRLLF